MLGRALLLAVPVAMGPFVILHEGRSPEAPSVILSEGRSPEAPAVILSEGRSPESKEPLASHPTPLPSDGKALYQRCIACHQDTGLGIPAAFPPLAGSEFVTGKPDVLIAILLHGLQGEVTVKGTKYNGVMMPYGTGQAMTDQEVADVLTYVRTSFGNKATPITAKQVAAVRAATKARTAPYSEKELRAMMQ
ncbi:MAG: cytochrome c [Gemmatimonadaceae bacterium]|nr:cytochrome c [Gemmatimonadaceae bacterium]